MDTTNQLINRDLDSAIPSQYAQYFSSGFTVAGKTVTKDSVLGLHAVYHAIDLISGDYAALPQVVYQKTDTGREVLDSHPVSRLLNVRPNFYQTPFEYKRMRAVHRLVFGESFVYIDRDDNGFIRNLLPIHPHNIAKVWESDNQLWYSVRNMDTIINGADILHVKDLSADEHYRGKSRVLDYCKEWAGRGIAVNEYTSAYFGNRANPGLIFEPTYDIDKEQRESLENSLRRKHTGSAQSHKGLIIPFGLKLAQGRMQFNPEESQLIQTKIQSTEEAAALFNIPLNKMRIKTDGNSYNSQEQANIEYVTDSLKPFSQAFQEEDNIKLFRSNEVGNIMTRMMLESRLKGDMKAQAEFIKTMMQYGIYNVDMSLNYLGQNQIGGEEGQVRYVNAAQMKLGQTAITDENNTQSNE